MAVAATNPSRLEYNLSVARDQLDYMLDVALRPYAQLLFSRSRLVGAVLLAATMTAPSLGTSGLAAVFLSALVAHGLHLSSELTRSGLYGYNGLLVGLGCAALLSPGPAAVGVLIFAVVLSVLLTAALHSAMGTYFQLPALTFPFLLALFLTLGAAPAFGLEWSIAAAFASEPSGLFWALDGYLHVLAALLFLPSVWAGVLVATALVLSSRIALLLSLVGYALGSFVAAQAVAAADPSLPIVLGLNGVLVAVSLGGIWFVPSLRSTLFAGLAVLGTGVVALGLSPLFASLGIPLLIVPFNMSVILVLYAMRQRVRDGSPKAVDFAIGSPEENLTYFRTRIARFGAQYHIRLRAPFLGRWVCTQGVDGTHTHRGPWRHALDFEVAGSDGLLFANEGTEVEDYHCYRLPVLSVAPGTIAKVVEGVPDNAVGEANYEQNWGNLVIVYHAPGLYSMVCHLVPGSIAVHEGQVVSAGDTLGLCGSSGRSPVPHLHFHLQASARVGAPTLPVELHNLVVLGKEDASLLQSTTIPVKGETCRNLEPDADIWRMFSVDPGEVMAFEARSDSGDRPVREHIEADVDTFGRLLLRSRERRAIMVYDLSADLFTVFDTVGSRRSVLHLIQMALGRVPLEAGGVDDAVGWEDTVPVRRLLPAWLAPLFDVVSPFVPGTGVALKYRAVRSNGSLCVEGESLQRKKDGTPWFETRAVLSAERGLESVAVSIGNRRHELSRVHPKTSHKPAVVGQMTPRGALS